MTLTFSERRQPTLVICRNTNGDIEIRIIGQDSLWHSVSLDDDQAAEVVSGLHYLLANPCLCQERPS